MIKDNQLAGKQGRKQVCKLPRVPIPSKFTKPPINLPLDFYHQDWFKTLSNADKKTIPDCNSVAFLPNAKLLLLPTQVPDEKLGDHAFIAKFHDVLLEPYGLDVLHGNNSNSSSEKEISENDAIDVDDYNKEVEEESDKPFLEQGDFGDLYDVDEIDFSNDAPSTNEGDL